MSLDELFKELAGDEILYEWVTLLSEETFKILDITDELFLEVDHGQENCYIDKRAVQDVFTLQGLLSSLIEYNRAEEKRLFESSFINCNVCYLEKFGSLCIQFSQCKHVYCKECMKDYFTIQISEGSVKALTCPEDKCDIQADPAMVKSLVNPDLFERYDELLLKRTLECMPDITNCPRKTCQATVLKDNDLDLGRCAKCGFVFCILCNNTYHGRAKCPLSSSEMIKLRETYLNGTDEEREDLEKRFGKNVFKKMIEDGYSEAWMERFTKRCPECRSSIQKIDGCNKMTCLQCRRNFCWLCNSKLDNNDPYSHFNNNKGKCYNKLFDGIEESMPFGEGDEDEDGWIQFV